MESRIEIKVQHLPQGFSNSVAVLGKDFKPNAQCTMMLTGMEVSLERRVLRVESGVIGAAILIAFPFRRKRLASLPKLWYKVSYVQRTGR
jgi:hypothetical protein